MNRTINTLSALALVSMLPLGCSAAPGDASPDVDPTGESSAALCTDPTWANVTFNLAAAVAGLSTSLDASYGSTACSGRFLVDLTNATNRSFGMWADWGDTPAVAGNCGFHYVTARVDGLLPQGQWVSVQPDRTFEGHWNNGVCDNRLDLGALQGLTPYTKVRIAARAFTTVGGDFFRFQTPAKVSVGFKQSSTTGY